MCGSIGHFQLLLLVSLSQSWSHQSCMVTGSWRLDKGYGVGTWISWLAPRKRWINVIRKHDHDIISLYFLHFCQSETGFSGFMFPTSTFQGAGHGGFLVGSCGGDGVLDALSLFTVFPCCRYSLLQAQGLWCSCQWFTGMCRVRSQEQICLQLPCKFSHLNFSAGARKVLGFRV
jgi:hypothetical protein